LLDDTIPHAFISFGNSITESWLGTGRSGAPTNPHTDGMPQVLVQDEQLVTKGNLYP
jgi:hypothetical protein